MAGSFLEPTVAASNALQLARTQIGIRSAREAFIFEAPAASVGPVQSAEDNELSRANISVPFEIQMGNGMQTPPAWVADPMSRRPAGFIAQRSHRGQRVSRGRAPTII